MGRSSEIEGVVGDLGPVADLLRVFFVICKGIILLLGVLGLAGSIYIIVVSGNYDILTNSPNIGEALDSGASFGLIVSTIVILISIIGILGAVLRWRPLLLIYSITWTILILLALIGAIISFYYSDNVSSAAETEYRAGLRRAIELYDTNIEARFVMKALQEGAKCCGIDNATDWLTYNPSVFMSSCNQLPPSCQCIMGDTNCRQFVVNYNGTNYPQTAYYTGCFLATMDYYEVGLLICGAFVLTLGVIEVFGVLIALCLIYFITRAKKRVQQLAIQMK